MEQELGNRNDRAPVAAAQLVDSDARLSVLGHGNGLFLRVPHVAETTDYKFHRNHDMQFDQGDSKGARNTSLARIQTAKGWLMGVEREREFSLRSWGCRGARTLL